MQDGNTVHLNNLLSRHVFVRNILFCMALLASSSSSSFRSFYSRVHLKCIITRLVERLWAKCMKQQRNFKTPINQKHLYTINYIPVVKCMHERETWAEY